jgi:hypothetical protein
MRTAMHSSTVITHIVTLLLGAALAAGLWLVGHADMAWLGFAAAAIYAQTGRCRPATMRPSQRPTP